MTALHKGLLLAGLHVALVGTLGVKLLADRAIYPRVWASAAPVDPNLPIRGRYVQLRVRARLDNPDAVRANAYVQKAILSAQGGELVATLSDKGTHPISIRDVNGTKVAIVEEFLAFYIPPGIPDPSLRREGEDLWVEVTLPASGPPRPIRLGIKKEGMLAPMVIY